MEAKMLDFRTILFATDFSESSDHAFRYALSMAKRFNARLVIIHVINEPVDLRGFYVPHISFDKLEEEIEEGAQKMMEKFCRTYIRDYDNYESFIVPGIPYEEVIKKGLESHADLIVMATHGRTGLDHVLFGSTAEKVVRKSPIPVMTIRKTED
jgi:nucleotide-binding universal stress UspA family protein